MKQKGFRIYAVLIVLALVLGLTGGKLAQPERNSSERDRFVGFQLCYESAHPEGDGMAQDRSDWTVYGNENLVVPGMGKTTVERRVLIGRYDEERDRYIFPGMEGLNCLIASRTDLDGKTYCDFISDLADTKMNTIVDTGDDFEVDMETKALSGTAFCGPPLDERNWNTEDFDYMWMPYEAYQKPDGTVYLTGSTLGGRIAVGASPSTRRSFTPSAWTERPGNKASRLRWNWSRWSGSPRWR